MDASAVVVDMASALARRSGIVPGCGPGWVLLALLALAPASGAWPADAVPTSTRADADEPQFATPTRRDRSGRIVAPIEINGRGPFRFILDTGANRSAISAETAAELGLDLTLESGLGVHGVTGTAVMPAVLVRTLRVGEVVLENQRLPVLTSSVLDGADGLLGIDCLQDSRVEVDFARDRVTIRRSEGRRANTGYLVVPAQLGHGGLLLVEGRVGSVPVKAILDTGAERSLGNEALKVALVDYSRRPRETVTSTVVGTTPQIYQGTSFQTPTIAIGGARLSNLVVTFGDLHVFDVWSLEDEPALLIGMDLLGALERFVVDYPRGEFHLKAWGRRMPGVRRCGANECQTRIPEG